MLINADIGTNVSERHVTEIKAEIKTNNSRNVSLVGMFFKMRVAGENA
jgi:hypothetical protein